MLNFFKTIYGRLVIALLFVFCLVAYVSIQMILKASAAQQQHVMQKMHADLASHVVKEYLLFDGGNVDLSAAKETFHNLMILGPNFEFYVLDTTGKVLSFSAKPDKIKRKLVDIRPIQRFLKTSAIETPVYGDNPRSLTGKKIFTASPIKRGNITEGYLYVILGSDIYDDISGILSESKLLKLGIIITIAGIIFSFFSLILLTGFITRPIRLLTSDVQSAWAQDFIRKSHDAPKHSLTFGHWNKNNANEIHVLGSAFGQLLSRLEQQYEQVITVDELRKELLTHVSHDLRSPLASLLGYLETWEVNSDKLTKEQSKEYIGIARKSAKKISNLIDQLFELAHLDSGNVQINMERFAIAELVQDVIQKFEITAGKKNITIDVSPKDSGITVNGDIEKLERVFTNLIENAIRHTQPGGSIIVRLNNDGKLVGIEVADTGIGIPPDDLPHVFDAHFKAANSVRGNTAHGGIGLAITKKIIDLHKTSIAVNSKVNEGTTFRFSLPVEA